MLVLDGPSANPDRLFAPLERSSIVQLDPIPVTDPPPRPPRGRGSGRACGPRRVLRLVVAFLLVAATAYAQEGPAALGETLGYAELLTLVGDAPSVQVAELALERAARQASATAVPLDLALSGGYDRRSGSLVAAEGAPSEDLGGGDVAPLGLTVRIDPALRGAGADELARARASVAAARDELAATRRSARIDAVEAFQTALRAEASAELAEVEATLAALEADAMRQRLAAGAASELDVAQAELALARAQQGRDAARRQLRLAQRALETVLGRAVPPPSGPLPAPPALPERNDASLDLRPDVRAARRDVDEADRTAAASVRDVLPTLTLETGFTSGDADRSWSLAASIDSDRLAPRLNASFDPDDGVQGVGPGGSLSRFEIGVRAEIPFSPALSDALAAVRTGQDQARVRSASASDRARIAVDRAYANAQDAAERAELARRSAQLERENERIVRLRAEAGAASDAAVRRAELQTRRADLDADRAVDDLRLAVFRLLDALAVDPESLE